MSMRKNAGRGLALITELVHEIAMANQPNAVGAIGHIDVYPNSRNIIPGQVVCTVDMRTHLLDKLNGMVSEFQERAPKICKDIEVDFECSIVGQFDPPAFDENCVNAVRSAAQELGYSYMDIVSGAGHDARWINDIAPTAMIMCPVLMASATTRLKKSRKSGLKLALTYFYMLCLIQLLFNRKTGGTRCLQL